MNKKLILSIAIIFTAKQEVCTTSIQQKKMDIDYELTQLHAGFCEGNFHEGVLNLHFIKRLEKAINVIKEIHKRGIFSTICPKKTDLPCHIFDQELIFQHEALRKCKKEIEEKRTLKPLLVLWSHIQKNRIKVTVPLLKEFSIMILIIYKAIYTACSPLIQVVTEKSFFFHAIALLCGNIASLKAFELLSIIDKLTLQIPKLLEKYELTKSELTWNQWLKKYWWLPPIAVAAIVLEAVFIYQVAVGKRKLPRLKSISHLFSKQYKKA